MARLRFFLACLVMLATPLQGFAAATMLPCTGMPGHHGSSNALAAHGPRSLDASGATHHPHSDPTATHGLADEAAAQVDSAPTSTGGAKAPVVKASACSVCAACCQLVAMTGSLVLAPLPSLPRVLVQTRKPAVPSRPAVVPDRPPRA